MFRKNLHATMTARIEVSLNKAGIGKQKKLAS
jgi:hypothetical protein